MMLTHVTIVVKDQNAALEFYTKKMGFEKKADYTNPGQPRWLTVGPKGQAIEMVLWQAGMGSDPNLPASHKQPGIGTRWVIEVDDVRKTFADLKAKGVKFKDAKPREEGWGFAADLTDPDGNHFTIHETRKPSAGTEWAKTSQKA
jgi:catechol 2,3-dioxygenase-like lactoylglutathione lyase family enzyme